MIPLCVIAPPACPAALGPSATRSTKGNGREREGRGVASRGSRAVIYLTTLSMAEARPSTARRPPTSQTTVVCYH